MLYYIAKFFLTIYFALFYHIKTIGLNNIPKTGPVLLCANHPTGLDMFLISVRVPRMVHYMAKMELFKNKIIGFFLKQVGAFPISRGTGDVGSVKTVYKLLDKGKIVGVFPEGTRTKKKDLKKRKAGAALFALHSSAPILPVAIEGEFKLFQKMRIVFGEPYHLEEQMQQNGNVSHSKEELLKTSEDIINNIYSLIGQ